MAAGQGANGGGAQEVLVDMEKKIAKLQSQVQESIQAAKQVQEMQGQIEQLISQSTYLHFVP